MSGLLSRLADPKLWLGIATLIVVLVMALHETERTSPGPLTTTHANVKELTGSDGCDQCHAPDLSIAGACASCHEAIGAQLAAKTGFHGSLIKVDPGRCSQCHVEHHGDAARLVDDRAFALAGVADRAKFDHGFTPFNLVGAHSKLECAKCHRNADLLQSATDEPRFLGLEQSCRTCHEDPHEGKFDANCAACHGQTSFTELDSFQHTEVFPLAGRHAGVSCEDCHAKDGPFAIEVVGAASYSAPPRACQACHESQHSAPFLGAVANLVKSTPQASCQECHPALDGSFEEGQATMQPKLHSASGFALVDGHADLDCAKCHSTDVTENRFQKKHPGDRTQRCDSCHETPHGKQFDAPQPTACVQCHSGAKWSPTAVTLASHTTFELAGAHAKVECNDCHQQAAEKRPRVYRGAPRECQSCHADAHENAFELRLKLAASESRAAGGSCALCHTTERFDAVVAERFDHSHWTKFELAGAHAKAKCEACHRDSATPDEFGRTFGRVADQFQGPVGACESCHKDAHRGQFENQKPAEAVPGLCARCHGVDAFRPALESFDHAATGFVLDGAHTSANCEACHGTSSSKADGRTLGFVSEAHVGAPKECATCHEDAHAGAFEREGIPADAAGAVGCARCHTTSAFRDVERADFEHGEWTGYPLRGAHARAACEACHVPSPQPDARGRRFGAAAGNECSACHVDVHFGQFAVGGRTDCARCHDLQRPLRKVVFDHQRDSRFALDANHVKLDCSACHRPWPTADGRTAIRFKPLGTECADCHGVSGGKK